MKKLYFSTLFTLFFLAARTQSGRPDSTFNGNGRVSVMQNPSNAYQESASKVLQQPDGKLVVLLTLAQAGNYAARYNTNGSLDLSFGKNGYLSLFPRLGAGITYNGTVYNGSDAVLSGASQADGKSIITGSATEYKVDPNGSLYSVKTVQVSRLNQDGTLDDSFGNAGILTLNLQKYLKVTTTFIQSDGKIVLSGYAYTNDVNNHQAALARLNPDGSPDAGFGSGGLVTTPVAGSVLVENVNVAQQPDGKLVAVLMSTTNSAGSLLLAQYNPNGTPDAGFGNGGLAVTGILPTGYGESGLATQADGRILVGHAGTLKRFTYAGTLDGTFAALPYMPGGTIATGLNSLTSVLVQPDGKILVGGNLFISYNRYNQAYDYNFAVNRYNADGSPDNTFSGDGRQNIPIYLYTDNLTSLLLQPDGKIVTAGTIQTTSYTNTQTDYAVARLNADGSYDNSFTSGGSVLAYVPAYSSGLQSVAVQADGKVLTAGSGTLYRFNPDGSPDNGFSGDGKTATALTSQYGYIITPQPDGKILVSGSKGTFALERYNADGSPDNTFHVTGTQTEQVGIFGYIKAVALQPDGKIVAAGAASVRTDVSFTSLTLVRYNADGTFDNSFDGDGIVVAPLSADYNAGHSDDVRAVAIQPDGKIVVGAGAYDGNGTRFVLARFNRDGSADNSFDGDGRLFTPFGSYDAVVNRILVESNGKLVAAGTATSVNSPYNSFPALAYYNADGSPDNAGGNSSRVITNTAMKTVSDVVLADDKFLYAGTVSYGSNDDVLLLRLNADGSQDPAFGSSGRLVADFGRNDGNAAVAFSGNRLYLAESSTEQAGYAQDVTGVLAAYLPSAAATPASGLSYRYYEGAWETLPDFSALTPVKTGHSANADISVRPAGVNTNYGFVWEGWINIPAAGDYTFETTSDDGSRFYFNSSYSPTAIPLVDNDGQHGMVNVKGTVHVNTPGLYPVAITFFQRSLDASVQLFWSGPGISRQLIPDAAFTGNDQTPPDTTSNGLDYKFYQGTWSALPEFSTLTPVKTGHSANADISVRPPGADINYAFLWQGSITIPAAGDYTFETISDDGSRFYFNTLYAPSAVALVNNDGEHGLVSVQQTIHVNAPGRYPVAITFFQRSLDASIQLFWSGPGIARQLVPDAAFTGNYPAASVAHTGAGILQVQPEAGKAGVLPVIRAYPNPFTSKLSIELSNPVDQGNVEVEVYDLYGRKVFRQNFGKVPAGRSTLSVPGAGRLPAGGYNLRPVINGVPGAPVKLVKTDR